MPDKDKKEGCMRWAVFTLGALAYWPVLWGAPESPLLHPQTREFNWRWMLASYRYGAGFQPLSWLSYFGDWRLWGLAPAACRAENILLHLLSAAIFYSLSTRLLRERAVRVAATALFALSPLALFAAADPWRRPVFLSVLFAVLALSAFEKFLRSAPSRIPALAFFFFCLSLLSGTAALPLPVGLAVLLVPVAVKLPFFVLAFSAWVLQLNAAGYRRTMFSGGAAQEQGDAFSYYNMGYLLIEQGRTAEAIAHLDAALRLKPDMPNAEYNIGFALQLEGRLEEAALHYEAALRIDPTYERALQNLEVLRR